MRDTIKVRQSATLSTNVWKGRAIVRLKKCSSPSFAQLKFKPSIAAIGRAANRVYERL
jgi:hypothetical protein